MGGVVLERCAVQMGSRLLRSWGPDDCNAQPPTTTSANNLTVLGDYSLQVFTMHMCPLYLRTCSRGPAASRGGVRARPWR